MVYDGTLKANRSAIVAHGTSDTSSAAKVFTFNFDNVIFGLTDDATTSNLLVKYTSGSYAGGLNINLNGCTFDLNTKAPTSAVTLINVNNTYTKVNTAFTLRGTKILANSLSNFTVMSTKPSHVSVELLKDEDGLYGTLKTLSANTPYTGYVSANDANRYFVEVEDNGEVSLYELQSLTTKYGTVPHATITKNPKYLSAIDYPFFIFEDGAFVNIATTWKGAVNEAKKLISASTDTINETAEIVMRRGYDAYDATDSGNNFNGVRGTVVADLNGYTLKAVEAYIIDVYFSYSSTSSLGFESSILFKNGTIENGRQGTRIKSDGTVANNEQPAIGLGHTGTLPEGYSRKKLNFAFENITFKTIKKAIIQDWGHAQENGGLEISLTCNGCTFDFTGAASGVTMLHFSTNRTNVPATLKLIGSKVIADNIANYSVYSIGTTGDGAILAKGDNGQYMSLTQLTESAFPTTEYKNAQGLTLSYGKDSETGAYTTYLLGEPIKTEYGYIPFKYQSEESYPFAVFNEKGEFINISDTFYGANSSSSIIHYAKDYLSKNAFDGTSYGNSPRAAYIIMRRDYKLASNETYNNMGQVQGVITIDLCGNKLTAAADRVVFPASIKPWSGSGDAAVFPSFFVVMNGEISIGNKALINYEPWGGDKNLDVSKKNFDFTFKDIDFSVYGNATSLMASYSVNSGTPDSVAYPSLIFEECTFDLKQAKDGITLFDLGNGKTHANVSILGGEIISDDTTFKMFNKIEASTGSVTFGKTDIGNYTALLLPSGIAAPSEEYALASGGAVFVKISEDERGILYRLRPTEVADISFTPKMSLTLDSKLIINVYVPAKSLVKFTFDGIEYNDLSALADAKTEIGGEEYYLVKAPLAASEGAKAVKLIATVDANGKNAQATFSFSVVKYASKVLSDGSATEQQLVCDILSYVRAAYEYFGTNDDGSVATINELLGEGYDESNAPAFNGSADEPSEGLLGAALVLDSAPAIRFYISTDASASDYAFYIGDRRLSVIEGNDSDGRYLELDLYAYSMCETITYTVNGKTDSYHINSYYAFAKESGNEALITLVERLAKYCESAKAYHDYVIG